MFGALLTAIEFPEVVTFLQTGVREGVSLDFKIDFPSNLEKTLSAFANTYGGVLLIGVGETTSGAAALPVAGVELKPGLRERVLQKGLEAVYPPILPEVHVVEFRSGPTLTMPDRAVVVVRVAESDQAPHSVDGRTVVYLRNDNVSTPFRKATLGEIEWLSNKRQLSVEQKDCLIERAADRAANLRSRRRTRNGPRTYWREGAMVLTAVPVYPRVALMETSAWSEMIRQIRVPINALPTQIPTGNLQRIAGGVFFDGEYSYSEFQSQGLLYYEFDYWWDYLYPQTSQVVRQVYPSVTAALINGVLESARLIFQNAGYRGLIDFSFAANGLKDAFFLDPNRTVHEPPKLVESEITIKRRFTFAELEEKQLEISIDCQTELYWAFGFQAPERWIKADFGISEQL